MPSIIRSAAEWAHDFAIEDMPPEVSTAAIRAILDTIGVMLAGGRAEAARRTARFVVAQYGQGGGATVFATDRTSSPQGAAFANGVAAHAFDFDDTCYSGICHGSAVILPAILAVAEQDASCSGRDLLRAFVVGSEIAYALGRKLTDTTYYRGWFTTSLLGTVGAAAGAAVLLNLDVDGIASALGNAMSVAGGARAVLGSAYKPVLVGDAASRGLGAAYLAAEGLSAPEGIFEHRYGFLALFRPEAAEPTSNLELPGSRWSLLDPGLAVKTYPVCSAAQAAIEAVAGLADELGVEPGRVRSITCRVPKLVAISLPYRAPRTMTQAQFSLQFSVACALLYRGLRIANLVSADYCKKEIGSIMSVVEMEELPADDPLSMRLQPEGAEVHMILDDGAEHIRTIGRATGMPEVPLSNSALDAKFRDNLSFAGNNGAGLEASLRNLPAIGSIRGFLRENGLAGRDQG